jgi:hypothetical protein
MVKGQNKCTDEHYYSEGDLFYFWDPDKAGCPLKGNTTDVLRVEGRLERLENTTSTSNMMAFMNPFIHGKVHSYQTLMRSLEKSNGEESTYLMDVNGDEDNKFRP